MDEQATPTHAPLPGNWTPVSQEPRHPLAALDGQELAGRRLRVLLGPTSRFGARYFALMLASVDGHDSREPVLRGLHNQGPLTGYNWVEVAATADRVTLAPGGEVEIGADGLQRLLGLLLDVLPPGGHLMVEYDSPQRAETARSLALGVPPIATPLGEILFRIGCGAHFKDWQIAEGGSEGPRKLQAYKPPSQEVALRWRREASQQIEAFLEGASPTSAIVRAARERAAALLPLLAAKDRPST